MAKPRRRARPRGNIEQLPSGSLRVRVYAGTDPVSKRPHYLTETIPAGDDATRLAEQALTRFQNQVDEKRNPRTNATVNQLLDRWLEVAKLELHTRRNYVAVIDKHIRPVMGDLPVGRVDAELLDSFYAMLGRCRDHCGGRRKHHCQPLADSSIRQLHWILSGAFKRAVRWKWLAVNPVVHAEPPPMPHPNPEPPSMEDAARLVLEAFAREFIWGCLVWLAMTLGARLGELCALRWSDIDLSEGTVAIKRAITADDDRELIEKDTKTYQQRRVAADPETHALLQELWEVCSAMAERIGSTLPRDAFIFSRDPDGATPLRPESVSQRYARMAQRLGIDTILRNLRHYSATELINAGVDVRTVAGRLGHGGGGVTTLRVYAAWLAEADQRAAKSLAVRMPARQSAKSATTDATTATSSTNEPAQPRDPYQQIASDLRGAMVVGALNPGDAIPTAKTIAARYKVSVGTAHRAVALLADEGLVVTSRGKRAVVADQRPAG